MDTSTAKLSPASRWLLKALPIGALALSLFGCETLDPSSEAEPPSAKAELKSPSSTTNAVVQTVSAPRPIPAPKPPDSRPPASPPPSTPPHPSRVTELTTAPPAGKKGAESLVSPNPPVAAHVTEHPLPATQPPASAPLPAPENHAVRADSGVDEPPQGSLIVKGPPPRPVERSGHGLFWVGLVFSLICLGAGVSFLVQRRSVGTFSHVGQGMPPKLGEHDLKAPLNPESGPAALVEES